MITLGSLPRGSLADVPEADWSGYLVVGTKDAAYVDLHDENREFLFSMPRSTPCETFSVPKQRENMK